jgi:hypothetical protein
MVDIKAGLHPHSPLMMNAESDIWMNAESDICRLVFADTGSRS